MTDGKDGTTGKSRKWKGLFSRIKEELSSPEGLPEVSKRVSAGLDQLEAHMEQKREWSRMNSERNERKRNEEKQTELDSQKFFEMFVVCGLPPDAEVVAAAVSHKQARTARLSGADASQPTRSPAYRRPGGPTYPAQVLYSWPQEKADQEIGQLVSQFCFPNGVAPQLVERTPSLSAINEILFGLTHEKEDSSFCFVMKGEQGANLYGVCVPEVEIMRLPPSTAKDFDFRSFRGRYVISTPRCYCLLSYNPFYKLHFDVIDHVLRIERVQRLRRLMSMSSESELHGDGSDWYASVIGGCDPIEDTRADFLESTTADADAPEQGETRDNLEGKNSMSSGMDRGLFRQGFGDAQDDMEVVNVLEDYHGQDVPPHGVATKVSFRTNLYTLQFKRWEIPKDSSLPALYNEELAKAEAAAAAGPWAIVTLCRNLSLDNILAMLSCVLLEKQVAVFSPYLGTLTAVVLSMGPLMLPFLYQSILLPVLPSNMVEFLDAPVPFLIGLQHKTLEVREKTSDIVRVNVYKNKIKAGGTPPLPRHSQLVTTLCPHYEALSRRDMKTTDAKPVFNISADEEKHAAAIIAIINGHLRGLCANLLAYTITNINDNNQRVSLVIKESFVASFPGTETEFMQYFVDTQIFDSYADCMLDSR